MSTIDSKKYSHVKIITNRSTVDLIKYLSDRASRHFDEQTQPFWKKMRNANVGTETKLKGIAEFSRLITRCKTSDDTTSMNLSGKYESYLPDCVSGDFAISFLGDDFASGCHVPKSGSFGSGYSAAFEGSCIAETNLPTAFETTSEFDSSFA